MAASNIPVSFPIPAESAIASYDSADLITGQAFLTCYLGHANAYVISNTPFYSDVIGTEWQITGSGTFVKGFDYDYDIMVNKNITFQGSAICSIPFGTYDACHGKAKVLLRKWNGATETEIASAESAELAGTAVTFVQKVGSCVITVPETTFAKGEYIRLTVELYGKDSGGDPYLLFCQDPMSRLPELDSWAPVTVTSPIVKLPVKVSL